MQKALGPFITLNPTSSYIQGWSVPYLYDEHESEQSLREEFTYDEAMQIDFRGITSELEHCGARATVGVVVGHRPGDKIETLIELPASANAMTVLGKNGLFFGHYNDLSLRHRWERNPITGAVSKKFLEVSICEEGARPGSHITQFYPSERLLKCQNLAALQAFTAKFKYTPPPPMSGDRLENLNFIDVDNTPELAEYVDNVLWPEVHARRQTLLKQAGYIAGSKKNKLTNELIMSAAAAATIVSPPTAQETPATTVAASITPTPNPAAAAVGAVSPSLPPPPAKTDAIVPPPPQKADVAASDSMAEDTLNAQTEESRIAMWQRAKAQMDALKAQNEQLQAQVVAASKEKKQAELIRRETEAKTQIDMMLDNHDGMTDEERQSAKERYHRKFELLRNDDDSRFNELVSLDKAELGGMIAASKRNAAIAAQARPSMYAANQWSSRTEQEIAKSLAGPISNHIINQKNYGRISNSSSAPFSSLINPESDERDDNPRSKKRAVETTTDAGVVAASRGQSVTSTMNGTVASPLTQNDENWVGKCYKESLDGQSGQARIIIPSQDELMQGGFAITQTNVVRKSKDAYGNTISTPEIIMAPRFETQKQWDLRDLDKDFAKAVLTGIITGHFQPKGREAQTISCDAVTMQALQNTATANVRWMQQNNNNGRFDAALGGVN